MLFRPSFCANCGEKIERTEWHLWTSRRFCQVCESEFKGQDLIPKAIVIFGVVAAIFGFGSFSRSGSANESPIVKQPRKLVEQPATASPAKNATVPSPDVSGQPVSGQPEQHNLSSISGTQTSAGISQQKPKTESGQSVYYCGAATKKGTPCSRRVKGNTRCFQHTGMPAMLPAEKLRLN